MAITFAFITPNFSLSNYLFNLRKLIFLLVTLFFYTNLYKAINLYTAKNLVFSLNFKSYLIPNFIFKVFFLLVNYTIPLNINNILILKNALFLIS